MNVMITASGPIVIDWTNAARGEPLLDVAVAVVLLTCPQMPGSKLLNDVLRPVRQVLGRTFSKRYPRAELDPQLVTAAAAQDARRELLPRRGGRGARLRARGRPALRLDNGLMTGRRVR